MICHMSGDQRVAAAGVPGDSGTSRRPRPAGRFVTGEYRRAQLSVVLALLLLAGTAVYLVVQEREQTWASGRGSVLNLALGLETSITGLIEQSAFSLTRISGDLAKRPASGLERAQAMAELRNIATLDPISSYLGVRTADGGILAVDQSGGPVASPEVLRASGLVAKKGLVKVLGEGRLTRRVSVSAHAFSAKAASAIEAAGGTVTVLPPPFGHGRPPAKGNALTSR